MGDRDFRWQDGERLIRFGRGALADAPDLLGDGYVLLTTERALASAPVLAERAAAVHHVAAARVDDAAGALRDAVEGELLVALGGGRVIDVAKALAAADPPRRAAAVPTTLSAAEMTSVHRHAAGVSPETPRVRAAIVLNDPALSASQPEADLAASAGNALAHAAEAPATVLANPVATLAALEGARLLVEGLAGAEPDRDGLALGALLAGYAIRLGDLRAAPRHGADAGARGRRRTRPGQRHPPAAHAPRARATRARGDGAASGTSWATERRDCASAPAWPALRDLGVEHEALAACADAAAQRPELDLTPPRATRDEILEIYEAAW